MHIARYSLINASPLSWSYVINTEGRAFIIPGKSETPASFETTLNELEQIVIRLEGGSLPLGGALNEFERGVRSACQRQIKLQQVEQCVQILLSDAEGAALTSFTSGNGQMNLT